MTALTLDHWADLRSLSNDDDDELEGFDFVDSGDITVPAAYWHSGPYQQLQDIFEAARTYRLADEETESLLSEVQNFLVVEMHRFRALPDMDLDLYSIGREHIMTGLELLSEACLVARFSEQRSGLAKAAALARQGDDALSTGRQLLDRAAAIFP